MSDFPMRHIAGTWPERLLDGTEGRAVVFRRAARREHAARVWQAMLAVLAVAAIVRVIDGPYWDDVCDVAGWLK